MPVKIVKGHREMKTQEPKISEEREGFNSTAEENMRQRPCRRCLDNTALFQPLREGEV